MKSALASPTCWLKVLPIPSAIYTAISLTNILVGNNVARLLKINTGWRIDYWLTSNRVGWTRWTKSDMIDSGARQDSIHPLSWRLNSWENEWTTSLSFEFQVSNIESRATSIFVTCWDSLNEYERPEEKFFSHLKTTTYARRRKNCLSGLSFSSDVVSIFPLALRMFPPN